MKQLTALAVAVVVVTGVSGCAGSTNKTAKVATTQTTSAQTPTPEQTPTPAVTSGGTTGTGALLAKCEAAGVELGKAAALTPGTNSLDSVGKAAEALKAIVNSIPEGQYRDAMKVITSAYEKFAAATKGVTVTPGQPPSAENLKALQKLYGDPKFAEAAQLIGKYFAGGCKG